MVKGSKHSEASKKKISEAGLGKHKYWLGKTSTFKGKRHTEEAKEKNRQAHLGKIPWNKGLKGKQKAWNKGIAWSEASKQKMKESSNGYYHTEKTKKKISASMKILKNKPEERRKSRRDIFSRIGKALREGEQLTPFYNLRACEFFYQFDEINNTKGQYATNGGEFYVLGYWLDYINHEKKIIIEWDEEYHYIGGNLKHKDIRRQAEIEKQFSDYTFIRIRESKYIPKANELLEEIGA